MVPAIYIMLKRKRKQLREARRIRLKREFLTAATIMGDYLRSGYAIENAVRKSANELRQLFGEYSVISMEWKQLAMKTELNVPIETAFREFADRSEVPEIRSFSEVFDMVNRSGGGLGDVVNSVTEVLTSCFETEEQIQTMITAKRFEQQIMNLMPMAILLYIRLFSPELLNALYGNLTGVIITTVCLGLYILAVLWAEKIILIKV